MINTPGQQAKVLIAIAHTDFKEGNIKCALKRLMEAFDLKSEVESYAGTLWQQNHHDFTAAMLDMSVLHYKLANFTQGDQMAARAQAWADDPNCSSKQNFEQSFKIRNNKLKYFFLGLVGRFRSVLHVSYS